MNDINLIPLALNYYDVINKKNEGRFNRVKYVRFHKNPHDKNKRDTIAMFNENQELIEEYDYEVLGMVNFNSIDFIYWTWSWAIPDFKKKITETSRNMLQYGWELEPSLMYFLKTELSNSRFRITNPVQIDIHVALGAYLSKASIIYRFDFDPDKLERANDKLYPVHEKFDKNKPHQSYFIFLREPKKFNPDNYQD
jgi:hypothetical protein